MPKYKFLRHDDPLYQKNVKATDWDHRIITAVSVALDGEVGRDDDVDRLRKQIEEGPSDDRLRTACEIAVAFIRWAQDLKVKGHTRC